MAAAERPRLFRTDLLHLGYQEAVQLQERLRDACIASEGAANYLLCIEHPATITLGRRGRRSDVLAGESRLAELGVSVAETNRGGEVTFHGPGQLVVYPIVHLKPRGCDLHRYLRDLEGWLVRLCRSYGVPAHADSPHTGVWVENRKIASIGIAVRRWVSYHGVALNVSTDLSRFDLIVPCGLRRAEITSLERELGSAPALEDVAERAARYFAEHFEMSLAKAAAQTVATA